MRPDNRAMVPLVVHGELVPFRWNGLTPFLRCRGNVVFKRDKVTERRRIWKWRGEPHRVQLIIKRFRIWALGRRADGGDVIQRASSRCHGRWASSQECQHGRWHLGIGQPVWLRLPLI